MLPPFFTPQPVFSEARVIVDCFRKAMHLSSPERIADSG
jgi:hypothetical protein